MNGSNSATIRILAVDDHPLVREGLASIVGVQPDMTLVAEAANGREAIQQFRTHRPDVTLMDLRMPEMSGLDALITIRTEFPDAKVIVLTTYEGDVHTLQALKAGAQGYLLKSTLHSDLLKTIRAVHAEKRSLSPEASFQVAEHVIGRSLGPYSVLAKLAEGGMGEVYLARDTRLGREVALKVLPPDLASDPERLARFEREARTVASLSHPNIVTLHTIEDADGLCFLTMERVTGKPLSDVIGPDGMPLGRLLDVAIPIADALAAAHQHGIVHRDLKPANVMVNDEGRVKVLDFGLAKPQAATWGDVAGPTETVTTDGRIVGTVPYMAPEQLRGERADPQADIFSFGVMLYEMAAGARPFRGESAVDVVSAILRADPDPLDRIKPQLPLRFVQLVRRCLEKSPQRRAQSALDLRQELQDLADDVRTGWRTSSTPSGDAALPGTPVGTGTASSGAAVQDVRPLARESGVHESATTGTPAAAGSRRWMVWAGALAAALVVVALVLVGVPGLRQGGEPPPGGAIKSLAVLPFANMSQDASQDFFVEGIHEALITDLARLGTLKVTSRNSVQRYNGKTLQMKEVARDLNVDALIEGSVLRAGNKVRITAQLIVGATDEHAWADSYDRDVQDVLAVLSDVSRSIAHEVHARVGGSTRPVGPTPPSTKPPESARRIRPEALDAYLRGRQAVNNGMISAGTSTRYLTESTASARKFFEDATRLDPQYADAWSGLAFTTMSQGFFGVRRRDDTLPVAREAAGKALEIDPSQGEAYGTLGILDLFFEWNFEKARLELEKAIALNPYDVHIRHGYADYLVAHGRARESLDQVRIAREHNPNSPWAHLLVLTHLGMASRDWSEVLAEARRVQATFPTAPMVPGIIADCLWRAGKYDAALAILRQLDPEEAARMDAALRSGGPRAATKAAADDAVARASPRARPFGIAAMLADADERDAAFAWLEKAFVARQPQLLYLPARAEFDRVRDDPRYRDLLRRIGLPVTSAVNAAVPPSSR